MSYISKITLPTNVSYDLKDKLANIWATCSTADDTAQKTVTISDFDLVTGMTIHITFDEANSAASPTLKINDLTAAPIRLVNDNLSPWDDGETVALTWDGTYWNINDYSKIEVVRL